MDGDSSGAVLTFTVRGDVAKTAEERVVEIDRLAPDLCRSVIELMSKVRAIVELADQHQHRERNG
jgi:hypothetical protein